MRKVRKSKLKVYAVDAAMLFCAAQMTICINAEPGKKTKEEPVRIITEQKEETGDTQEVSAYKALEILQQSEKSHSMIKSRDWDADEAYMLAKIAMAEAEGEDTEGKALVICTVLNRVWTEDFPETIESVLFERTSGGGWQFSPMEDGGRWYTTEPNEDCYKALELVTDGWDESQGALYFESQGNSSWHKKNLEFLFQHGGHYFYKNKEE